MESAVWSLQLSFGKEAVSIDVVNLKIFTNCLLIFNLRAHVKIEITKTGALKLHLPSRNFKT